MRGQKGGYGWGNGEKHHTPHARKERVSPTNRAYANNSMKTKGEEGSNNKLIQHA